MDALQPGDPRRVGRYRLLKRLGAGGMGRVYLGQSPGGRLVAVKVIRPELADDPDFRSRFAQEVTAARRVSGIFTAPVVDADPDAAQPWMVTAYVSGPSLADAVGSQGPLPIESVFTLAAGLTEGLGTIHAAGVVHRDLKPSNVLLASDGPRIIDFGISRAADSTGLTRGGGVVGSPGFMSPEQAEGREVGPATDIFSLGGVLAYAATGEPPFGAGSASALLYRVVYGTAATGNVPAELRALVERCLAKDPAARPTTDELLAELGYVEPAEDWLTWERPVLLTPVSLHATEADQGPYAEPWPFDSQDEAGRDAAGPDGTADPGGAGPDGAAGGYHAAGLDSAGLAAGSRDATRDDRPGALGSDDARPGATTHHQMDPAPSARRTRRAILTGLAAAAVVAVAAAVTVGAELASHHDSSPPATRGGSQSSVTAGTAGARKSGKQAEPAISASPSQGPGGEAQLATARPRAVVLAYYAAINHREWRVVWRLGGSNLSPSYRAMVAGYADTARDVIRYIHVSGDHVVVRMRAYELSGASQLYRVDMVVREGVILTASQSLL